MQPFLDFVLLLREYDLRLFCFWLNAKFATLSEDFCDCFQDFHLTRGKPFDVHNVVCYIYLGVLKTDFKLKCFSFTSYSSLTNAFIRGRSFLIY